MKTLSIFLYCFGFVPFTFCQKHYIPSYGVAYTAGKIIQHTKRLTYQAPNFSQNVELNYFLKAKGTKDWHILYKKPTIGFNFTVNDYQDPILGKTFAVMPFLDVNLLKVKSFSIHTRLGEGLAYATKYWQRLPYSDSVNNYLGSKLNLYASIAIVASYQLNQKIQLTAGSALSHTSNGGTRKPNFGINLFGAYTGIVYTPNQKNKIVTDDRLTKFNDTSKNKIGFDCRFGFSMAELGIADGPLLPIYVGTLLAHYRYKQKHKLFIGLDWEYNSKTVTFIRQTQQPTTNEFLDASYISATIGNEFMLGRFSIPAQVGFYLNSPYLKTATFYQKFGLFYYPYLYKQKGNGLYTGLLMKSNAFNADYIEAVLGFSF